MALLCEANKDFKFAKVCAQKALHMRLECQGPDFPDVKDHERVVERIKKSLDVQEAEMKEKAQK